MDKVARICWNTNAWKRPSGSEGKSKDPKSYENIQGFGHEEWLLDSTKNIDGYHYAFLQPMNRDLHRTPKAVYNIHLFTYHNHKKYYIGCLKKAIGVGPVESKKVYEHYCKMGWIKEMKESVVNVKGKVADFDPEFMFNVKFKIPEAQLFLPNPQIIKNFKGIRYSSLMNLRETFELE